jgi:hypothetical protein
MRVTVPFPSTLRTEMFEADHEVLSKTTEPLISTGLA